MELILTTEEFRLSGVSYAGFPILINEEMEVVEEIFDFLIYYCIQRGRVQSPRSWENYGQCMYDFFNYLDCNHIDWRSVSLDRNRSLLAGYRDWALSIKGLSSSTVNSRLKLIMKFYEYALKNGWVDSLPFDFEEIRVSRDKSFLAHTDTYGHVVVTADTTLKRKPTQIKVLNLSQVRFFIGSIQNTTQRLIARMGLQTGLRKEELCTFPLKYVENPDAYNELTSHISVYLDPRDMTLKGGRPRTIDIPVGLMADLWQYVVHERNVLDNLTSAKKNSLFLTRYGTRYNGRSLNSMWSRLNLPFKVTPHTLRHTYATHTLYALGNKEELRINPLMYLRDRLGHSSIITTQRYLHFIHQLTDEVMTEYQDEIDGMSAI